MSEFKSIGGVWYPTKNGKVIEAKKLPPEQKAEAEQIQKINKEVIETNEKTAGEAQKAGMKITDPLAKKGKKPKI